MIKGSMTAYRKYYRCSVNLSSIFNKRKDNLSSDLQYSQPFLLVSTGNLPSPVIVPSFPFY